MESISQTTVFLHQSQRNRITEDKNNLTKRLLHLAIQLLCLQTEERYVILKKFGPLNNRVSRSRSSIMECPPPSLIPENKKILEATNKIIELLTGEVPIRYQDLTVYFSMEEWEYIEEHEDLFTDVLLENQQLFGLIGCFKRKRRSETTSGSGKSGNCRAEAVLNVTKELIDLLTGELFSDGVFVTRMEKKIHQKSSWIPTRAREKNVHRHHCCPLPKIRTKSPIHDRSVDPDAFQQRAKMLNEFLEDFVYTLDNPGTCRCQESSTHGLSPVTRFLHPIFKFLSGRCDSGLSRLHRNLEYPFDLLHSWFLKMESVHWHRLAMVVPWLQDLLEMSHRKPKSHRQRSLNRKLQRCQPSLESLSELQSNVYQTAYMELPKKVPYEPGQEEELKNSLKVDLEKHQLYLTRIESRLSCLERRAEDVTRHLEKANLELQDIKRGHATLQTLVDQQTSSAADDFEYLDLHVLDSLFEDVIWSGGSLQTRRACCNHILPLVGLCRTRDLSPKPERSRPTAGREQQSDVEAGIYQCQDQINVLLQQISQQIDQTEMDLNIAINQACRG
ncbi:uncharacterized protein LOC120909273 isoform X3 [Rana temporaria]|uniref:uncharacterized protein LOC120909273 isoform X3 n=1 Tax=Rana temporaria TaxID=8407 RepID=UPI001AAD5EC2|nr:uncharacterized protein LOC120909273 isoform X3 [Rana temporaria]